MPQTLPNYNFPPATRLYIDGRPYLPPTWPMPGRLSMMDCQTGQPFVVPDGFGKTALPTEDDFDELFRAGRIEVVLHQSVVQSRAEMATAELDMSDLEAIDPKIRKVIAQVELLDANGVKNGVKAITNALKSLWTSDFIAEFGEHDNPATIKRWRAERGEPGNRPARLLTRLTGQGARRSQDLPVPLEIRMKHALQWSATRGPRKTAHALAAAELIAVNEGKSDIYKKPGKPYPIFSYATFVRDCNKLLGSDTIGARDGKQMVEATMRGGGKPLTASRILDKVIIDHTPLDAFLVIDPERDIVAGRPSLTIALDVHSRAILAWILTFRPPSYWTVCETLRRMNLPKRPPMFDAERYPILKRICGKPNELIVDNAAEFRGHGLEDAAKSGSFSVRFCPIKMPRYRAIGERAFLTIPEKMLENLPGKTMPIEYCRRADYDAQEYAVVTMNEMEALANKAIAEYHTEPHEGIMGQQPALVFQKSAARHGIDVMGDVRRFQLGPVDKLDSQSLRDVIQDSFCGGYLGAVADGGCRVGIL